MATWRLLSRQIFFASLHAERCFAAGEGTPNGLIKNLDRDVTVIDWREVEKAVRREFKDVRMQRDAERVAREFVERKLASGEDVPMVEDLPLTPEEETPDFRGLAITLQLRGIRALEHWWGNTHLTLSAIIVRMIKE